MVLGAYTPAQPQRTQAMPRTGAREGRGVAGMMRDGQGAGIRGGHESAAKDASGTEAFGISPVFCGIFRSHRNACPARPSQA